MKKKYSIIGAIAVISCATLAYCYASSSDQAVSGKATQSNETATTVSGKKDKVLVTYFTLPETDGTDAVSGAIRVIVGGKLFGNTEYIAKVIQEAVGGDMFVIKTTQQYPGIHKALVDFAKKENEAKARPKLSTHIDNFSGYDVIFVGFPNWWYDMPMPIYTFFDEYDFSGKTVIPFCTHGGSRFSSALQTITEMEKGAKVIKGLSISRDNTAEAESDVLKWLQTIGMIK